MSTARRMGHDRGMTVSGRAEAADPLLVLLRWTSGKAEHEVGQPVAARTCSPAVAVRAFAPAR